MESSYKICAFSVYWTTVAHVLANWFDALLNHSKMSQKRMQAVPLSQMVCNGMQSPIINMLKPENTHDWMVMPQTCVPPQTSLSEMREDWTARSFWLNHKIVVKYTPQYSIEIAVSNSYKLIKLWLKRNCPRRFVLAWYPTWYPLVVISIPQLWEDPPHDLNESYMLLYAFSDRHCLVISDLHIFQLHTWDDEERLSSNYQVTGSTKYSSVQMLCASKWSSLC